MPSLALFVLVALLSLLILVITLLPLRGQSGGEHGLGLVARRVFAQLELLERRQRPVAQGGGERGAAGVGDLVAVEIQPLERLERACGGLGQPPRAAASARGAMGARARRAVPVGMYK